MVLIKKPTLIGRLIEIIFIIQANYKNNIIKAKDEWTK